MGAPPYDSRGRAFCVWKECCIFQKTGESAETLPPHSPCFYAVSMLAAFCSLSFSMACSRILYLRILPAAFMGKAGTKSM